MSRRLAAELEQRARKRERLRHELRLLQAHIDRNILNLYTLGMPVPEITVLAQLSRPAVYKALKRAEKPGG